MSDCSHPCPICYPKPKDPPGESQVDIFRPILVQKGNVK